MGRVISVAVIVFAVVVQGLPATAQEQKEQPTILATGEWPPITSVAFLAPYMSFGRAGDVVFRAFDEAGYTQTQIEFHSFGDAYDLAKDGEAAAAFPYYKTPERQSEMVFSAPLMEVTEVIFYDKDHAPNLDQVRSLEGMKLVLEQQGSDFQKSARFVEAYCYDQAVEEAFDRDCTIGDKRDLRAEIDAFKALLGDRNVLILPSAQQVGERILQTWFSPRDRDRIGIVQDLKWKREVFLLAPKGPQGEELIANFNSGLETIRDKGLYSELATAPLPEESVLRTVRLTDPGTFPLIVASKDKNFEKTVVLPRGTAAKVVQWSPNFLTPERTTLQQQLNEVSRVMIMNGPQQGQLLWVKNVFIALD